MHLAPLTDAEPERLDRFTRERLKLIEG